MRSFLVTVQVILIVAGLGGGGFVGYRAFDLIGKEGAALELQADLVLAVLALMLVVAAGVIRPREAAVQPAPAPAPQRRTPNQPPYQQPPGGYRPGGPHTGSQPPIGGGPHTGSQPPIGGGPHTGPQPPIGGPDQYGGRTEKYPRP